MNSYKVPPEKYIKLKVYQYSNLLLTVAILLLVIKKIYVPSAIAFAGWYLLFSPSSFSAVAKFLHFERLGYFFIYITFPYTLLPFSKAWYLFEKSYYILRFKKDPALALKYATLVNPENLIVDNSKCFYYGCLASLYHELDDIDMARKYYDLAVNTPHKQVMNEGLEQLNKMIFCENSEAKQADS